MKDITNEEIIETLRQFDKKCVEELPETSRNLFYAIMSIADERDELRIQVSARETIIDELEERIEMAIARIRGLQEINKIGVELSSGCLNDVIKILDGTLAQIIYGEMCE